MSANKADFEVTSTSVTTDGTVVNGNIKCKSSHLTSFSVIVENSCSLTYNGACYDSCPEGTQVSKSDSSVCAETVTKTVTETEKETITETETSALPIILLVVVLVVLVIVIAFAIWKIKKAKAGYNPASKYA